MWWASMPPPARWLSLTFPSAPRLAQCAWAAWMASSSSIPPTAERAATTVNIMVVGHKDGIVMIESGAKEETEEVILAAIEFAHAEIKKIVAAIDELVAMAGKPKRAFTAPEFDEAYYAELKAKVGDRLKDALDTKTHGKTESYALIKQIKDELAAGASRRRSGRQEEAGHYYEHLRERIFREQVTKDRIRPDRRAFDEIREITIETSVLPRTHGSALFTRGETQALVTATLGTPTTASGWRAMRARRKSPSCCTTTSRRSAWAKRAA